MTARNTPRAYGWVARLFHWSVAALIFAAIGLGFYANNLPTGSEAELQAVFATFSWHKTVGVTVLALAVLRILWTMTQPKPRPLHPGRKLELFAAEMVHWALWIGMVIMPLTGWIIHSAAPGGFSRILWPIGQRLPFIPEDAELAKSIGHFHETGWWVLAGLIVLHVAGALKHALIDRDGTLARMAGPADRAPEPPQSHASPLSHLLPILAALAIWTGTALIPAEQAQEPLTTAAQPASGWAVQQGTLGIEVAQGGAPISGQFASWQAAIDYDPTAKTGHVAVSIDIASLTLGAVSDNAKGPDFLNAPAFPTAKFEGDIQPPASEGAPHIARGTLTIAGKTIPAELPFSLEINGSEAKAKGEMKVDRRDFGIGAGYADESTVGFPVTIRFDLTATQQ
ncbi:cytochrome b/b6 domain-containing protein [Paracoccus ravus]|uniref:cytochrome b/b6 domain-containing protein n=1 Tax=Paracoccus ravus TaxID=2447760 RepID=UPI00106EC67D|nr:cytochrome b/b6 domain-containing protein [Paracoccus ravus]